MVTLQNDTRTFRLEFLPAGPDRFQVRELCRDGDSWQERQTITVSAERAVTLKRFALQNDYSIAL